MYVCVCVCVDELEKDDLSFRIYGLYLVHTFVISRNSFSHPKRTELDSTYTQSKRFWRSRRKKKLNVKQFVRFSSVHIHQNGIQRQMIDRKITSLQSVILEFNEKKKFELIRSSLTLYLSLSLFLSQTMTSNILMIVFSWWFMLWMKFSLWERHFIHIYRWRIFRFNI